MRPRDAAIGCVKQINESSQTFNLDTQVGIALVLALVAVADAIEAAK